MPDKEGTLSSQSCSYPHEAGVPFQLGHDGASPESCWLVEELCLAVPTQGTKYTVRCNCWLAKDRGDGVTSRVFDLLDALVVNIGVKVWGTECTLLAGSQQGHKKEGGRRSSSLIYASQAHFVWSQVTLLPFGLLLCDPGKLTWPLWALLLSTTTWN